MVIEFEEEYLRRLYEEGDSKNKKKRFQPAVIKQYIHAIDKLRAAETLEDLYKIKSLNYECLKGNKKGLESVRVNKQYRIEFMSRIEGEEPDTIVICSISALSNHYKN